MIEKECISGKASHLFVSSSDTGIYTNSKNVTKRFEDTARRQLTKPQVFIRFRLRTPTIITFKTVVIYTE